MARQVDTPRNKARRVRTVDETSDHAVTRFLYEQAERSGMASSHDTAMMILCGVLRFIVWTRGDAVARGAVSELAGALDIALRFNSIEHTGVRH
jgi:hypothetical protein